MQVHASQNVTINILQNQLHHFIYKFLFERNINFIKVRTPAWSIDFIQTISKSYNGGNSFNYNNKFITETKRQSDVQFILKYYTYLQR